MQETRIPQGVTHLDNSSVLYNSSNSQPRWTSGVGFVIKQSLTSAVKRWMPINDRICAIIIRARPFHLCIVNIHSPSNDADDKVKEDFYSEVEKVLNDLPRSHIRILIGDMNAKIGQETCYRPTIGKESLHVNSNENGEKLINLAMSMGMTISSTYFPRKQIHKQTWTSPDGVTRNQIDHVLISNSHKSSIQQVRSYRGADIDSDHFLVIVKMKLRLSTKRYKDNASTKPYNHALLKSESIRSKFEQATSHALNSPLEPSNDTIEGLWSRIKETLVTTANKVVGPRHKGKAKPWFDEECTRALKKRQETRLKWLRNGSPQNEQQYREIRKATTKLFRQKKRTHQKGIVSAMEEAKGKPRIFYQLAKFAKGSFPTKLISIKDKNGDLSTEQAAIFGEYFDQLLNSADPPDINQSTDEVQTQYRNGADVSVLQLEEVEQALTFLKSNKAPGLSNLSAELLRAGGSALALNLWQLLTRIWTDNNIPTDWSKAIVCPIFKKGDPTEVANYRGISLLEIGFKVLTTIINNRLKPLTDDIVGDYQSGFTRGRSTTDHIFALRIVMEKYYEFNIDLHMLFVDFRQAYDSINREVLWQALDELLIPGKYIQLIRSCYAETHCVIRVNGQYSQPFEVKNGLRQGDPLAPLLFNLALEWIMRKVRAPPPMQLVGNQSVLAFADDVVILGNTVNEMSNTAKSFIRAGELIGLKVNEGKTKYMHLSKDKIPFLNPIKIDHFTFQAVASFRYLGSTLTYNNDISKEVNERLTNASKSFYSMAHLFSSRLLSTKTKISLYKTLLRPILIYGCESWSTPISIEQRIADFERKILRKIYTPVYNPLTRTYEKRTKEELGQLFQPDIIKIINHKRLAWWGHALRSTKLPNKVLEKAQGKRTRGRPRTRWQDRVKEILQQTDQSATSDDAYDRERWSEICSRCLT